ncbi:MAG: TIGR00270 family protein [Thermococci archaeon]|nr:TIGR00270 family protein [Thermococci archaeon]
MKAKPRYCEICGALIKGPGHRIRIEGSELLVCDRCYERYGKKQPGTFSVVPKGRSFGRRASSRPIRKAEHPHPKPRPRPLYTEDIVEDYAERVYDAIRRSGMSYEELSHKIGLSVNLLRRIAHGDYTPTISEAKKIERFFNIKLIERVEEDAGEKVVIPRDYEPTLGDVANIRVRKRKR